MARQYNREAGRSGRSSGEARVKCPRCHDFKNTREVPVESGYDHRFRKYVCDNENCLIGWYELPGKRSSRLLGDLESARKAYDPIGKPVKK